MANLFFAREGRDPNRSSQGIHMDITDVVDNFSNKEKIFFRQPPLINPENNPSPYSSYTLVVIEIEEGELSETFPDIGFYYFPNITPAQCVETLNIDNPPR